MSFQSDNVDLQKLKIEYEKECIRNRVRNANVGDNVRLIPPKPTPSIYDGPKKVAIYARVSTSSKEQVSSIENQRKYYKEKIAKIPDLEMVEMYVDEGKSGTSTRGRDGFKKMIDDAGNKKFDVIMCASVSRFARNITDAESYVKYLKTKNPSHPIGVQFETENIYTLDPNAEDSFHLHTMLAAMESRNKSRRMILSYDQRICTGQFPVADLLGYRHTKDGRLLIQEDEATTVRFIFLAYMNGYTCDEIAQILTEKQRKTLKGRTHWNANMVRAIMQNERRWGDLEARKRIVADYETKKTKKNEQERFAAYITQHHEGIVNPEIAKAIQLLNSSNKKILSGVPDFKVIQEGALKGFISINPAWGGIDNNIFIDICKSVYSEDEYNDLEKEARILSGKEHTNVIDMSFQGFEVPTSAFLISQNTPALTISNKSISFNKECYRRFENVDYIEVLYHPILQMILIRPSVKSELNAICWLNKNDKPATSITTNSFSKAIFENLDWIEKYKFRFRGISRNYEDKQLIMFYLEEPQIIKNKKSIQDNEIEDIYIKYKKSVNLANNNVIGFEYALKNKRYQLPNIITKDDIKKAGIIMQNPLIGEIPTKEEIDKEINELLKAM